MSHPSARARGPIRTIDIWLRPDATVGVGLWGPDSSGPFTRLGHRVLDGRDLSTPEAVLAGAVEGLRMLGWTYAEVLDAACSVFDTLPAESPQPPLRAQE